MFLLNWSYFFSIILKQIGVQVLRIIIIPFFERLTNKKSLDI
jgi:hypothetical protein